MTRFSKRRSLLTLAISGILFTAAGCDSMESEQRKADIKVEKGVAEGTKARRTGTAKGLNDALAELNKAVGESGASSVGKIRAKSLQAQTEFESAEHLMRDLNNLAPAISRLVWDISQTASQVQKFNDNAKALAATNPDATLAAIAAKRTEMVTVGEAAGKKAAELQGEIDKIKGQVAALVQQKDAAFAEADATAEKAAKATGKDAVALLDQAGESRRKSGNLGHDVDKLSATLLPFERDLAVEQAKKKTADEAVAALDASRKAFEENWQAMQAKVAEQKSLVTKLGEELAAKAKELDDVNKQAAALRGKAADLLTQSKSHYAGAGTDAKVLATELGAWSDSEKFSASPEKKAWEQLRGVYHVNIFKLLEGESLSALAGLYANEAAQIEEQQKAASGIAKALQDAGLTMPAPLAAASADAQKKALEASAKAATDASERFKDVTMAGGRPPTPKDVQLSARISRMFTLYGQALSGDKSKLNDAKEELNALTTEKLLDEAVTRVLTDNLAKLAKA